MSGFTFECEKELKVEIENEIFLKTFSMIIYIHIYLNACKVHPS